jgi:cytoskeletal protein CcmA (bactofilin family)
MKVDGAVEGQTFVRDRMDLSPSAQVQGDVVANRLIVADGASFSGKFTVGRFASESKKAA